MVSVDYYIAPPAGAYASAVLTRAHSGWSTGHGKFFLGDGSVYTGSFVNGEIEGHGQRTWPDGSMYTGEFKFGEMDGEGEFEGPAGRFLGTWRQNQREGPGILYCANGDRYEGLFHAHRQHDPNGTLHCANGDVFEGNWERGVRSGPGRMTYSTGDVYEGSWAEDVRAGDGTLTYASGMAWSGPWEGGEFPAKPRFLQLFTDEPPAPPAEEGAEDAEEAPTEPESGDGEGEAQDPSSPTAPPLLPAEITVAAGEALPALNCMAVSVPAAEPPPPVEAEGGEEEEEEEAAPENEEGEVERQDPPLSAPVASEGEAGRLVTVTLLTIPPKVVAPVPEPEPEPEAEGVEEAETAPASEGEAAAEGEPENDAAADTVEADGTEAQAEVEDTPPQPEVVAFSTTDGQNEDGGVTLKTVGGVARFASGTLVIPAEVAPGTYELLIEDTTPHSEPGMKLTTCRLPSEPAHEIVTVIVKAPQAEGEEATEEGAE
eukprot:COSAG02_NODE_1899_length_10459_cov_5.376544_2_plen_486_part_00